VSDDPVELMRREVTPELYREVRELWKAHSMAEDRRDIAGLIATLTPDCVYEVLPGGARWEGHAGATRFYTELLSAFPDVHFDLQNIVIGPQGACEEAKVTGTHRGKWLEYAPSGQRVEFRVVIFFPWDLERKKFKGERVFAWL
jgi:predicted ester cyclase